jgi:hypothetical protein
LRGYKVRCELDASTDNIKAKIANAEQSKSTACSSSARAPASNAVSVRIHS